MVAHIFVTDQSKSSCVKAWLRKVGDRMADGDYKETKNYSL